MTMPAGVTVDVRQMESSVTVLFLYCQCMLSRGCATRSAQQPDSPIPICKLYQFNIDICSAVVFQVM